MTMELFKVGPSGQMEIDFESLEAMTSKEFVAFVKMKMQRERMLGVHVECENDLFTLYVRGIGSTHVFDCFLYSSNPTFEYKKIFDADVTAILKMEPKHWGYLFRG